MPIDELSESEIRLWKYWKDLQPFIKLDVAYILDRDGKANQDLMGIKTEAQRILFLLEKFKQYYEPYPATHRSQLIRTKKLISDLKDIQPSEEFIQLLHDDIVQLFSGIHELRAQTEKKVNISRIESPQRRGFLKRAASLFLSLGVPKEANAQARGAQANNAQAERWDVSYLWHPDIEAVLDYMEEVATVLGPNVSRDLRVVRGGRNFGLIYDRDGSRESSVMVATNHTRILQANDLNAAGAMRDEGYQELFNVSYGLGPNLNQQKRNYDTVLRILGPAVGKDLVIEMTDNDNYILVYRRRGSLSEAQQTAQRHTKLLSGTGIGASYTREQNNETIYRSSTKSQEEIEEMPNVIVSPPARKPEAPAPATPPRAPTPPRIPPRPPAPRPSIPSAPSTSNLEVAIENQIDNERDRKNLAADETTSWSVYDFTTGDKLVTINEDASMQCASMVKPFVALGIMHRVAKEKSLRYSNDIRREMTRMIQRSNNGSTNRLMQRLGGPSRLQVLLRRNYGEIFQQTSIVEYIPSGGRSYRNRASAHDYSRFLYALFNNDLPESREIRRLMGLPNRDRVYTGAKDVPSGTAVIDKTGSTARLCGDMAILYAKGRNGRVYAYTLVGIIEKRVRAGNYGEWITSRGNVIRRVSNTVYNHMQARHNLI